MSKKLLALVLAIVMVLGAAPALALFSSADDFYLYGDGYEEVSYNPATLEMTSIKLLFIYDCSEATKMSQNPGNYTWVMAVDGVNYTVQPDSFYSDWLVRFKPIQWSTPYVPAWGSTVVFQLTVYKAGTSTVVLNGPTASITFPNEPERPSSVSPTTIAGTNVTWTYDNTTGTLTFDGTGSVPDYNDKTTRPWHSIKDAVVKVVVKGGVTRLGKQACNSFNNLDEIVLEEGVTSTGFDCFANSGAISMVRLPSTLTTMEQGGFYSCSVTDVDCPLTSTAFATQCSIGSYNDALTNAHWINDPVAGYYGDLSASVSWNLNQTTGVLTISGTGAMPTLATKPWQQHISEITAIVIEDGITSIPGNSFNSFSTLGANNHLTRIEIADSVTSIGGDAFAYDGTISYLRLSSNVTSIGQGVLYSTSVTTISCTKDWQAIQNQASVGAYNDAFGEATWVDVVTHGEVHHLTFGKYGSGMENWGTPRRTQILITPEWDNVWDAAFKEACMNQEWTLVIDDGTTAVTTHLWPNTIYDGGDWAIIRFVPALAAANERFVPVWGVEYTITATITYDGVTDTVTSGETFVFDQTTTNDQGETVHEEPITYSYYTITWVYNGSTEYTEQVAEGFEPSYHGSAPAYYTENGIRYDRTFTPEIVPATANATYTVTYDAHIPLTFGKYGNGFENWGDPLRTQFLICPLWDGEWNETLKDKYMAAEWTFVFDDGTTSVTTHLFADTYYDGDTWGILRFVPGMAQTAAERFTPTPDVEYTVTATVTIDGVTVTHTSEDKYVFASVDGDGNPQTPITYTYYTITWQIDGVTEYTEDVIEGFEPVYHGSAASHVTNGYAYVVNMPEVVPAAANATYNITYTVQDITVGTLSLWNSGYENTDQGDGVQTHFLLKTRDWEGNEHTAIDGHTDEYDWILTVNGTTYNVKPSSSYGSMLWRFEPVLWSTPLIPQAGSSYTISLEIYDANQALVFQSAAPVTIEIADDFVPVHAHTFTQSWLWEENFVGATLTMHCAVCNGTVVLEAPAVDNGDNTYTATATYDGVEYSDTAYGTNYAQGDVNGDNVVNITDVTKLLDYLGSGDATGLVGRLLDVNRDGAVNITDVTTLLDILGGSYVPPAKSGLYDEDGGVRLYAEGTALTGFQIYSGHTLYFDPETALMVTVNTRIEGTLYIFEPFTASFRTLYEARAAKNGLYEEDGGIRFYADEVYQTGFVTDGGYKMYFDPDTGLMHNDELIIGTEQYAAPTAVNYNGLTVYAYGDALPVYVIPENGVLTLAPDGTVPFISGGYNPSVLGTTMTVIFEFYNTATGLDLPAGTQISYNIRRGNNSTVNGTSTLDSSCDVIRTSNGYVGLRFDIGFEVDLGETIRFTLSFTDANGKSYSINQTTFTKSLAYSGLGASAFAELAEQGISVSVNESEKKIVLTGTINGQEYTNTLQLGKWDGNTSAAQIVECAKLFFEVYPPMYERFHGISNPTNTLTLAVENEDYGVAYASGSFVHIHDQWLASNPIDYDCLTHEFAHVIQNGWDGNYCEVSDYIEHFANVCRYIYAIGGGKYNDAGGWNLAPGSSCKKRTDDVRFLLWMDYTYTNENYDFLARFYQACKNKQYRSNKWVSQAWPWIFQGSGMEGMSIDAVYQTYLATEFAELSTIATCGISPLDAKYNVHGKYGRTYSAYALYFPLCNSTNTSDYSADWSATLAGQQWDLENFSNGNGTWDYVKCGTSSGGSSYIRATIPQAIDMITIALGTLNTGKITSISLNVKNGGTTLTTIPLTVKAGRQPITIPEEYRAEGLTYEFVFVTKSSGQGCVRVNGIIANVADNSSAIDASAEPEINTKAWADFVFENGGSARYAGYEQIGVGSYNVTHNGANDGCAWELGNGRLQFLPTLQQMPFDNTDYENDVTWTIWYKDIDDSSSEFKSITTEPWSRYDTIYRIPTYDDGMTDLHSDNGDPNSYQFIFVLTNKSTGELVCWAQIRLNVTDSYDMFLAEQT